MLAAAIDIAARFTNELLLHNNARGIIMAETKGETGDCEMLRGSETENELNIACMTAENVSEVRVNIWGDDEDGCLTEQVLRWSCSFFLSTRPIS